MLQRLWLSGCSLFALLVVVAATFSLSESISRHDTWLGNLNADLQHISQGWACIKEKYSSDPSAKELFSGFRRNEGGLYVGEAGTIDGGRSWTTIRTFEPTAGDALPPRKGKPLSAEMRVPIYGTDNATGRRIVSTDDGNTWLWDSGTTTDDFELLDAQMCTNHIRTTMIKAREELRESVLSHLGFLFGLLALTWAGYRWGLWIARGSWKH
jgi:hypothetical protein